MPFKSDEQRRKVMAVLSFGHEKKYVLAPHIRDLETAMGVQFNPDTVRTAGRYTSYLKSAPRGQGVRNAVHQVLLQHGFTSAAGRTKSETVYYTPGQVHVVRVKNRGKIDNLIESISYRGRS